MQISNNFLYKWYFRITYDIVLICTFSIHGYSKLLKAFSQTTAKDVTSSKFFLQTLCKKLSPIATFCDTFPSSKMTYERITNEIEQQGYLKFYLILFSTINNRLVDSFQPLSIFQRYNLIFSQIPRN